MHTCRYDTISVLNWHFVLVYNVHLVQVFSSAQIIRYPSEFILYISCVLHIYTHIQYVVQQVFVPNAVLRATRCCTANYTNAIGNRTDSFTIVIHTSDTTGEIYNISKDICGFIFSNISLRQYGARYRLFLLLHGRWTQIDMAMTSRTTRILCLYAVLDTFRHVTSGGRCSCKPRLIVDYYYPLKVFFILVIQPNLLLYDFLNNLAFSVSVVSLENFRYKYSKRALSRGKALTNCSS